MDVAAGFGAVAALLGDPARARMIAALMDGRARTAKELAYGAGITPQTASSHLAKLLGGRLLTEERQSRHRYFRLATPSVGHAVEALMAVSSTETRAASTEGPVDGLRLARRCYDHLAGRLGVRVTDAMIRRRLLRSTERDFVLTRSGAELLERWGIDLGRTRRERRAFARQCLDWSERRPHLAGALGAAVASRCLDLGWVAPVRDERTLTLTGHGVRGLRKWFGIDWRRD